MLSEKKAMFNKIKKGDEVSFTAQIISLGNEFKMHHLHASELVATGGFQAIEGIEIKETALPGYWIYKY